MPTAQRKSRRRPAKKSRKSGVSAATKKYVRRMLPKVELKRNVLNSDEVSISTLTQGAMYPLTSLTQGTGSYQRIGNQVTIKGFHIKGLLNNNATTTNYMRMLLVWTNIDTLTTFSTAALFDDVNLAGGTGGTGTIFGANILYYPINKMTFKVAYDRVFKLGGSGDPASSRMFSKFIKMNTRLKYVANNAGDAYQDKQLSLVLLAAQSDDDVAAGQVIETSFMARTYYTDA
uniref:Capsid protein n=1 Tax=Emberiza rustica CRESS-DNA-virus sp. TaxID=2815032 RepID=A0A8A4XBN1_9VIRU|nr:MAG: capsid protein [Emberiza rustica CRESS-DNA-virus sp.]